MVAIGVDKLGACEATLRPHILEQFGMSDSSVAGKRATGESPSFALSTKEDGEKFTAALAAYKGSINDEKGARDVLVRIGVVKKTGGLTKHYK